MNCKIVCQIICFWKKVKTQQQKKQKFKHKNIAGDGNWTRDILHWKQMRYHCTTESTVTENIDCSQAI